MPTVELVFWVSLLLVGYVYVGYPAMLFLWSRALPRPHRRGGELPTVSILIAAHDEREHIERKLDDCLALDYPKDRIEILVSLDHPTDGTDELVRRRAGGEIRAITGPSRQGKAAALNRGMTDARGDVVVFCDARQRVPRGSLRELVAPFGDPNVGAVSGDMVLLARDGDERARGVSAYWRYEKAIRSMESRIHSTVGATGALYAVRRDLLEPIPAEALLDDVIVPMRVVLGGKRTVHEPRAVVYDLPQPPELELRRKIRTLAGNFQLLVLLPRLLNPVRNPVFLQFASHKLGRLAAPYGLMAVFASNLALTEGVYAVLLGGQLAFYALAAAGAMARRGPRGAGPLLNLPYTFVLLNWAAVAALGSFLRGATGLGGWESPRRPVAASGASSSARTGAGYPRAQGG